MDLRILPGGVLSAVVTERTPALLWRHARGIDLIDRTGHRVASVTAREVRRDLPLIAGEGAANAAPEALALLDAAGPILPRLRGLERMGERRWDVVLDRGQRIMLPAEGALAALEQHEETARFIEMARTAYHARRDRIVAGLNALGLPTPTPQGAFYVMADTHAVHENELEAARILLDEARVAVVPGTDFAAPGQVRLSYATSMENIEEVLRRLESVVRR